MSLIEGTLVKFDHGTTFEQEVRFTVNITLRLIYPLREHSVVHDQLVERIGTKLKIEDVFSEEREWD